MSFKRVCLAPPGVQTNNKQKVALCQMVVTATIMPLRTTVAA